MADSDWEEIPTPKADEGDWEEIPTPRPTPLPAGQLRDVGLSGLSHAATPQEARRQQLAEQARAEEAAKTVGVGEAALLGAADVGLMGAYPQLKAGVGQLLQKVGVGEPSSYAEDVEATREQIREAERQRPGEFLATQMATGILPGALGLRSAAAKAIAGGVQGGLSSALRGERLSQGENNLGELAAPAAVATGLGALGGWKPASTVAGLAGASAVGAAVPELQIPLVTDTEESRTANLRAALMSSLPALAGGIGRSVAKGGAARRAGGEAEVERYLAPQEEKGRLAAEKGAKVWDKAVGDKLLALKKLEKVAINDILGGHAKTVSAHEALVNKLANIQEKIAKEEAAMAGAEGPAMRSLIGNVTRIPEAALAAKPGAVSLHKDVTANLPEVFEAGALGATSRAEFLKKHSEPRQKIIDALKAEEAALKAGPPPPPPPELKAPAPLPDVPQSEINKYLAMKSTQRQQPELFTKLLSEMPEQPVSPDVAGKQAREVASAELVKRLKELRARPKSLTDKALGIIPGKFGAGLRTVSGLAADPGTSPKMGALEQAALQLGEAQKGAVSERRGGRAELVGSGLVRGALQSALRRGDLTEEQKDKLKQYLEKLGGKQ